ncbi:APC family permease [Catellatospora tritici]|uniref:APC family permease n=1 Tax=Catellatospora tritici TaxID=2851566 RepID=UPI001C2D3D8E|nr:APC family permease [Catellatospora tritici]MBV1854523.1 APC family permease [Catellatospora tritici]
MSVLTPQAEGSPTATTPVGDPDLSKFGYTPQLRRTLSFTDLLFYGLIYMVPIAPFAIFGGVFQASAGMVGLAYIIGMALMIFTAASYAQMVKAFPIAGSVYNYAGRGIGAPAGFFAGWAILLDYILVPGLLYLVASITMNGVLPDIPSWVWLLVFVGINTIINFFGIRLTAVAINLLLVGELIVLGIFLVVGITAIAQGKANGNWTDAFFNSDNFSWAVIFGAVSVAALSFLGFDGISMLAEENKGGSRQVGRAMSAVLVLAGLLFVAQTWVASLFVADPAGLIANGDPAGSAFYDAAAVAGGGWLAKVCLIATAIAWGLPDSMVAQTAMSRLLFAMARDRQLPGFLSKVSPKHASPTGAVLTTAAISLAVGGVGLYYLNDGSLVWLTNVINFGAMVAWVVLHISVIWHYVVRNGSRNYLAHLVMPIIGIAFLGVVIKYMKVYTLTFGFLWLLAGLLILVIMYLAGRRPRLSGLGGEPVESVDAAA